MKISTSKNEKISAPHNKLIEIRKDEINEFIKTKRDEYKFNDHIFRNHEWLYDIHWYNDNPETDYMPRSLTLVAEIELANKRRLDGGVYCKIPYSAVRFDFQKLLVANAHIRLMIFQVADFKKDILHPEDGLDIYFEQAIKKYSNLKSTMYDFLFVCFSKDEMHYAQISNKYIDVNAI